MQDGIYELLVSQMIDTQLKAAAGRDIDLRDLDPADSADVISRYLGTELARVLRMVPAHERVAHQLALCNEVLALLRSRTGHVPADVDVAADGRQLLAVHPSAERLPRPLTPMSISELLTGARGEPRLGREIESEIGSADRVDVLVSFIKWRGLQLLKPAFETLARLGRSVRVLTTTYMGASEAQALDWLARLSNVQVKVSFDHRRTRLHAKAWLFRRTTGFSTAYIGSANVSASALDTGLEWTLKACEPDSPHIIRKFEAAFETLWDEAEFEAYNPDDTAARDRLIAALAEGRGGRELESGQPLFFTLEPYPFQKEILEQLTAERELRGRFHNLVVAATGTGKTMLAAFDYARQVGPDGVRPRLLFVAHREELLSQAIHSFRHVLRDYSFGEMLGAGHEPTRFDHLFATIQSLSSRGLADQLGSAFWDYVVVDEFHHAAADSYTRLLNALKPRFLLGLTATPERADGLDVLHWFGGRAATEIRLWDALQRQLLTPFDYYGVHDGTDLREVRWSRGGYDARELEGIFTENDIRAELVVRQFHAHYGNPRAARALGFCVSVAHADFMARTFTAAGIPAISVSGATDATSRDTAISRLRTREVNAIFTCDLYNEGVDIPEADCLLMLRPTESATVFLQQLGRGLRPAKGKTSTLVLDFIGHAHRRFRFDLKLRALTGVARGHIPTALEQGFPNLPSGCNLQLDGVARDIVLQNLKQTIKARPQQLANELRDLSRESGHLSLTEFLDLSGYELEDVYERVGSWSALRSLAGRLSGEFGPEAARVAERLGGLLHMDDPDRIRLYARLGENETSLADLSQTDATRLLMLSFKLATRPFQQVSRETGIKLIRNSAAVRSEFIELCELLLNRTTLRTPGSYGRWPLALHGSYTREEEVLTAFGRWTPDKQPPLREGRIWLDDASVELMFVTLNKSEKRFSPTTRYEDYAISENLFHWQSQSTTSEGSATGQRYVANKDAAFMLFVRAEQRQAYTFLGQVDYLKHTGSRPLSITWKLRSPLPARLLRQYATLKTG
jgi:superfamily II DNA or RNA helicase/HKD family nuclease